MVCCCCVIVIDIVCIITLVCPCRSWQNLFGMTVSCQDLWCCLCCESFLSHVFPSVSHHHLQQTLTLQCYKNNFKPRCSRDTDLLREEFLVLLLILSRDGLRGPSPRESLSRPAADLLNTSFFFSLFSLPPEHSSEDSVDDLLWYAWWWSSGWWRLTTELDLLLMLPLRDVLPDKLTKPSWRSSKLCLRLSFIDPRRWTLGELSAILNDSFLLAVCLNSSWILLLMVSPPKRTLLVWTLLPPPAFLISNLVSFSSSRSSSVSWLTVMCSTYLGSSS